MAGARSFEYLDNVNGTGKEEFPFHVVGSATALMLHSTMTNANIRGPWRIILGGVPLHFPAPFEGYRTQQTRPIVAGFRDRREDSPALTAEFIAHPSVRKINLPKVLDDADIDAAAKGIVSGALLYSGQICFVRRLERGTKVLVGDITRNDSAIQPHVFTGVKPGTGLSEREVAFNKFSITIFDKIDEALGLANMSDYTLSSSLWTSNLDAAEKLAPRIRTVVNGSTIHSESFLGLIGLGGSSGYGWFSIEDFTDKRFVVFPTPRQYPLTS
ncbi:Aldehyde/histidinol dehydrogenase [Desarmillaria tabescens]|uniref:Aldehyde/histidinol dehydrogenase n=1 Tax=Armillaria tabescens TaxID=1929756 RepID=A0AA39MXF8_ARMTA|nr:Aldehyde/histidinol dehydrogenase [Desarmillaria tabescens]KAK0449644.1 Aldehyde/histidinol dehydrogenase [Desarmillaria tabescens]